MPCVDFFYGNKGKIKIYVKKTWRMPKRQSTGPRSRGKGRGKGRGRGAVLIGSDGLPVPQLGRPGPVRTPGLNRRTTSQPSQPRNTSRSNATTSNTDPTQLTAAARKRLEVDAKKARLIVMMQQNSFLYDKNVAGHYNAALKHDTWATMTRDLGETSSK